MNTFIEMLLENLAELLPFVVIYSYEGGVRWTWGRNPHEVKPGWRRRIWGMDRIETIEVVDQYLEIPVQSVMTQDDKPVSFAVVIGFRVKDPVKHYCEVVDFTDAIIALASGHLAKRVREQSYETLRTNLEALERSLSGTLETRVKAWGTEILSVGFKDFALVKHQWRIWGLAPVRSGS